MTQRNYQPGVLANAGGVPLHPQAQAMAGGMTYKPPVREAAVADEAHPTASLLPAEPVAGDEDTVNLRRTCPVLTKSGEACRSHPGEDGLCIGHRNAKLAAEMKAMILDGE